MKCSPIKFPRSPLWYVTCIHRYHITPNLVFEGSNWKVHQTPFCYRHLILFLFPSQKVGWSSHFNFNFFTIARATIFLQLSPSIINWHTLFSTVHQVWKMLCWSQDSSLLLFKRCLNTNKSPSSAVINVSSNWFLDSCVVPSSSSPYFSSIKRLFLYLDILMQYDQSRDI